MRSKTYQASKEKAPTEAVDLVTAISFLKEHARPNFDETVELHLRLGIDAGKSDQMVRGQVTFPAGAVKQQRIIVFTTDATQQKASLEAGAAQAGGEELIADISEAGSLDADLTIATPAMMPKVAKIARILGPQGLMPNPKTDTVSDDPAALVAEMQAGKISFKMDQLGNIHQAVGKISWEEKRITDNTKAFLDALRSSKPAAAKGVFLKSVTLKSTMSPAIRLKAE